MRSLRSRTTLLIIAFIIATFAASYFTCHLPEGGESALTTATIWLVWATGVLGLSTLFLAIVALDEIAQNRKHSEKALEEARKQHEVAIVAGQKQTERAIEAAREQSQDDRNHNYLENFRARQDAQQELSRQINEAQKQNTELIRSSHRPLLSPTSLFFPDVLVDRKEVSLEFGNVGSGVANNIQVAIFPKAGEFAGGQFHGHVGLPLANETFRRVSLYRTLLVRNNGHKIKNIALAAPIDPPLGERGPEFEPVYRLVFTYVDQFGAKHAGIYNLLRNGSWITVAVLKDIPYQIDELDNHTSDTP